ncbi:PaaI family thioesterase [Nocardia sp. NPDC058633]|uniref:PaaI family thioesterase n=1 Tax=Nocardia sp. NPDC058633 TaxID=3346568 RepID=UPI00364B71D3
MMTITLSQAAAVLSHQPFSTHIGARMVAFEQGSATLEVPVRDELRQQFGLVAGGVLASLADNALTFAGGSVLGPSVVTSGFTITYLRPATGHTVRAVASVVDATRRQAVCHCEVYSITDGAPEQLCAVAYGTARLTEAGYADDVVEDLL